MNQKEYELIGSGLLQMKGKVCENCREQTIFMLALKFAQNYSNFDRDKFLKACGL